jgi:hypothetical protein
VTAFKTDKYLKGIKTLPSGIKISCNAGAVLTNRMGNYGKLKVWYLPGGIANIFLMHELEKLYRITYDSWEGHYIVHTPQGAVKFYKDEQGLPYIDLEASTKAAMMLLQSVQLEETTRIKTATTLVQTVRENYEGYTKREILKAKEAHRGQAMIGNPSKGDYRGLVSSNMISNCPIAPTNITNVRAIFGPDLASVRGKMARRNPAPVVADHVAVPCAVVERSKVVMMATDIFFVDGTPFLVTLSRNIKFVTVEHLPMRTAKALVKHIKRVLHVYGRVGFNVRTILMD